MTKITETTPFVVHLSPVDGYWRACESDDCELRFHGIAPGAARDIKELEEIQCELWGLFTTDEKLDEEGLAGEAGGTLFFRDADGNLHRPYDLPAIESSETALYFHHGDLHRLHGPAVMTYATNGLERVGIASKLYFLHGEELTHEEWELQTGVARLFTADEPDPEG